MTKIKKLKALIADGKTIGFTVRTPGSERDLAVQSVILKNAETKCTAAGNWIILGRDVQLEKTPKAYYSKKPIIRSFRVDRIINGTITSA